MMRSANPCTSDSYQGLSTGCVVSTDNTDIEKDWLRQNVDLVSFPRVQKSQGSTYEAGTPSDIRIIGLYHLRSYYEARHSHQPRQAP